MSAHKPAGVSSSKYRDGLLHPWEVAYKLTCMMTARGEAKPCTDCGKATANAGEVCRKCLEKTDLSVKVQP